jgi:hypothetical protein
MTLPSTGYATAAPDNPASALTDFSLWIDLSQMPVDWWTAVDTSDGTKGRAAVDSSGTELAVDWINFNDSTETGWLRVLWAGSLATSGTQTIRIYPPVAANASVAASDTYGRNNAYNSGWHGYWPVFSDANDRTANARNMTAEGGVTIGGSSAGPFGVATTFDGTDDYLWTTSLHPGGSTPYTVMGWGQAGTVHIGGMIGQSNASDQATFYFRPRNSASGSRFTDIGYKEINLTDDTSWHLYSMRWDGSDILGKTDTGSNVTLAASSSSLHVATGGRLAIGRISPFTQYWLGDIAGAQVHQVARSDAWMDTEHAQTVDNSTFWTTWSWNAGGGGGTAVPVFAHHYRTLARA